MPGVPGQGHARSGYPRPITRRELRQAVALARLGAWRLARIHELATPDNEALASDLAHLHVEQAACWDARSRPGGREDSLGRLPRPSGSTPGP